MKNLSTLCTLVLFISFNQTIFSQKSASITDEVPTDYMNRSPIYDYADRHLSNTDTIPDFETKQDKLLITGTIYENDGTTPAKDIILYIQQPDENGDYEIKKENDKRYVVNRGWIKTDADGRYTFYTFVPGSFLHNKELKHIHPVIKEPGKPEYELDAFLFDNDPFLSKSCRKRMAKKGIDSILKLEKKEDLYVANKDIVLSKEMPANQ
ncbi:MAG: hypothetical protein ABIO60_12025 [Aquaticitalea sp.]